MFPGENIGEFDKLIYNNYQSFLPQKILSNFMESWIHQNFILQIIEKLNLSMFSRANI